MVEKDAVRRGYDELAETYAAHRTDDTPGTARLTELLGSLPEPARVLDAGCGHGRPVLSRLDGSAATAVGLDLSREQLKRAAGNVPDADVVQADMTGLPFADDAFDAVVAFWSLIHVPMADHGTVLEEFARVLRPGGRALVSEGTGEWTGSNPDWLDGGVEMQWDIAGAEATRDQLRSAGFTVVDTWRVPNTVGGDDADATDTDANDAGEDDEEWPFTFFSAIAEP